MTNPTTHSAAGVTSRRRFVQTAASASAALAFVPLLKAEDKAGLKTPVAPLNSDGNAQTQSCRDESDGSAGDST